MRALIIYKINCSGPIICYDPNPMLTGVDILFNGNWFWVY